MSDQNLSGIWRSTYWYPSNQHDGEDASEYYVEATQRGNKLKLTSLPQRSGAFISVSLTVDGDLVTGVWEEKTSPEGEFEGAIYSGALQLIVSQDGKSMTGKWVGIGQDDGVRQIYCGRWELKRARQSQ